MSAPETPASTIGAQASDVAGFPALDRRQLIGTAAVWAGLAAVPAYLWSRSQLGETGQLDDQAKQFLTVVCDIVIPRTDTPGATDVGVPALVVLALNHGLTGTRTPSGSSSPNVAQERKPAAPAGLQLLTWLTDELTFMGGGNFVNLPLARQQALLGKLDADAFVQGQEASPWRQLKALILLGYYTSEAGASKELRYELVPGRWDPDLPQDANTRAWSSDWTALTFG